MDKPRRYLGQLLPAGSVPQRHLDTREVVSTRSMKNEGLKTFFFYTRTKKCILGQRKKWLTSSNEEAKRSFGSFFHVNFHARKLLKTPSLQLPNSFMSPPTPLSIRFNHILGS